jgi:hypothetical protein
MLTVGTRTYSSCASVGLVNIYAPSGSSQRQARETFYNVDLPYTLGFLSPHVIMGGDFNGVLSSEDCTGKGLSAVPLTV